MAYTEIDDPSLYFSSTIWTGNATDDRAIVIDGTGMQPDFVWIKSRNDADNHRLVDSVRGATKHLEADTVSSEQTSSNVKTFTSTGFTLSTNGAVNANSELYVSWSWKESATAGFDIVSFTGNATARTISHSLSAVPKMIIMKNLETVNAQWVVYHVSTGNTQALYLNTNAAPTDVLGFFNDTDPTSSVFTVGTDTAVNGNTVGQINYAWSEKQGFSKFGRFSGNHNSDGAFVYLGFRPAWLMIKRYDTTEGWYIYDSKRDTYNGGNLLRLYAHAEDAESAAFELDLLSNGFKMRNTDGGHNRVGDYIVAAFAEAPFVNSNGVPCNAR